MKLLFQVDAADLDGQELVSVDREAPAMANEKGTTVDASDQPDHLGLHLHPTLPEPAALPRARGSRQSL
jgi:hypothetical protein